MLNYFLLILNIILVTSAQLLLKLGTNALVGSTPGVTIYEKIVRLLNPYLILGGIVYAGSFLLWIYILSKNQLSYVYPIMSLSYVTTVIAARYFLSETISLSQVVGVLLIITGTLFIFPKVQ